MNAQPIDPRALKAAKQFRAEVVGLSDESTDALARIIQSHFAEPQRSGSWPKWHHGGGFLCRGTIRVAREDFDTDPSDEFKKQIFDEICAALNKRGAESVNGKLFTLLSDLTCLVRGECPSLLDEDSGGDSKLSMAIDDALSLAQSQPPSMADELAEALRSLRSAVRDVLLPMLNAKGPHEVWLPEQMQFGDAVVKTDAALDKYDAQKGQS